MGLCVFLSGILAVVAFVSWRRAPTPPPEPPPLVVTLEYPPQVKTGETFTLRIRIHNGTAAPQTCTYVSFDHSLQEHFHFVNFNHAYGLVTYTIISDLASFPCERTIAPEDNEIVEVELSAKAACPT